MMRWLSLILVIPRVLSAGEYASTLRLDPHLYAAPRGEEPREQIVAQTVQEWREASGEAIPRYELRLHVEGETRGRRDLSVDIDRAWLATPFGSGVGVAWGRVHPWDLSLHPGSKHPWRQAAQLFPQNQGVLLGYGLSPVSLAPTPVTLGWVGAHLWTDFENRKTLAFGISIAPLFIPSSGPELSLSTSGPATTGRFGRRPPGFVDINGTLVPIRYELDRSRLWQDILLQPQAMIHSRLSVNGVGESWLSVARAPSPTPTFDTSEYLRVQNNELDAVAIVRPRFHEQWLASLSQRWYLFGTPSGLSIISGAYIRSDHHWGYELGLDTIYIGAILSNEITDGTLSDPLGRSASPYGQRLLQLDGKIPILGLVLHGGAKTHLSQNDLWLRGGINVPIGNHLSVEGGVDVFAGPDDSYFGEWRTNDRVYSVLRWEIGA